MSEMNFDEQFERALKAGEEANRTEARAVGVNFDRENRMIVVELRNGSPFTFPVSWISGLRDASDDDIAEVVPTPSGEGLHWNNLDEDLSLPALIDGFYGPDPYDDGMFVRLCSELESSWFSERQTSVVDRLAYANPRYSAALYAFFGELVESELTAENPDFAAAAETARDWLNAEGFDVVRKIAEETANSSSTTTSPPTQPDSPPPESVRTSASPTRPVGKVLSFPLLIPERTGLNVQEAYQRMDLPDDLVFMVLSQPAGQQQKIRQEIAGRSEWLGMDRSEAFDSLQEQLPLAARNRSTGQPRTFREKLAAVEMSEEQRNFWLSLADEDN
jgi:hypothetical protein